MRYQRNPRMGHDPRIFQAPLKEYSNWREAWWREAIQNSVDAKARNISCMVIEDNDTKDVRVIIEDDGTGMSREILETKFLTYGGTGKEGTGSVGGFGKAKELLLFPWKSWRLHTRNIVVNGCADYYEIEDAPMLHGTRLEVVMYPEYDKHTTDTQAIAFIKKCNIPRVNFTVNGNAIEADLTAKFVKDLGDDMSVYYDNKSSIENLIYVRINGIFMFSEWISGLRGAAIIEVSGSSVDIFAVSRDTIRDYSKRRIYQDFVNSIIKDTMSGLRGGNLLKKRYIHGKKFSSDRSERMAKVLSEDILSEGRLSRPLDKFNKATLDSEAILRLLASFKNFGHGRVVINEGDVRTVPWDQSMGYDLKPYTGAEGTVPLRVVIPDEFSNIPSAIQNDQLSTALMMNLGVRGPSHVENAVKLLMWEPDFYLLNEIEDYKIPAKLRPEKMMVSAQKLAHIWAELCRFVLIQLGASVEFGVGFCFSWEDAYRQNKFSAAQYLDEEGEWLLLNPYRGGDPKGRLYNISSDEDMDVLYALAIHECTHLADQISYHDESFANAFTRNVAKTIRGRKNLKAIREAVSKRVKR